MINFLNINDSVVTMPLNFIYGEWTMQISSFQITVYLDKKEFTNLYSMSIAVGTYVDNVATTFSISISSSDDTLTPVSVDNALLSSLVLNEHTLVVTLAEVSVYAVLNTDYMYFYFVDSTDGTSKTLADVGFACDGTTPLKKVAL